MLLNKEDGSQELLKIRTVDDVKEVVTEYEIKIATDWDNVELSSTPADFNTTLSQQALPKGVSKTVYPVCFSLRK